MKPHLLRAVIIAAVVIAGLTGGILITENNKAKLKDKEIKEYNTTLELVKDINQNSDFGGLELLKYSDKTAEDQPSQGASDILPEFAEGTKEGVEGIFFPYPYGSLENRLAKISIEEKPYHVYGITVGQTLKDVTPILLEKGFTRQEEVSDKETSSILYRQHHVSISLKVSKESESISTILVSVYDKVDNTVY